MEIGAKLTLCGEPFKWVPFPDAIVGVAEIRGDRAVEDEEPAIDPAAVVDGLFGESGYLVANERQLSVAARGTNRRDSRLAAMAAMEPDRSTDIDVAYAIAIGQAEILVLAQILESLPQSAAGHRVGPGVNQRDFPILGIIPVNLGGPGPKIDADIRHVEGVIEEILLDHVPLVPKAHDELVDPVLGIDLHDVPEDRFAADLHHWLGANRCLFRDTRAKTSCENDGFHAQSMKRTWSIIG
jgi:hypothetical protein